MVTRRTGSGIIRTRPSFSARAVAELPQARATLLGGPWLTAREVEVLNLMARGGSHLYVAHQLGISRHTVAGHAQTAYAKLDAAGALDAFRVLGWLRPPPLDSGR